MRNWICSLVALALVGSVQAQTFTTNEGTLADFTGVNSSNSFTVGDKVFSNFVYSATGIMPSANQVNILGGTDSLGNFGFRLSGAFGSLPGTSSDALLSYNVSVDNSGNLVPLAITDAHLFGNPTVVSGTGSMTVAETFSDPIFNTDLSGNSMSIFSVVPGTTKNSDSTTFLDSFNQLNVSKDVISLSGTGSSLMSFVDQTFSQSPVNLQLPPPEVTPEPASLALVLIGGAACLVYRRRTVATVAIA